MEWDDFKWKDYFIRAVETCLDSSNFRNSHKARISSRVSGQGPDGRKDVSREERRNTFYKKVVAPLHWLATVGFGEAVEVPTVALQHTAVSSFSLANDKGSRIFWESLRARCSFFTGDVASTKGFLGDLQIIAEHISRCRRQAGTGKAIKVAILDSGCDTTLPFFQNPQRSKRLKRWKDFTSDESADAVDQYGHGTLMASLLMNIAPIVDVYIARITRNTNDLEAGAASIARVCYAVLTSSRALTRYQAIEHAGLDPEWEADLITMSFSFTGKSERRSEIISESLSKVTKQRKDTVLFFASAGNSWDRTKEFPTCHENVIPIYAADAQGKFLASNPSHLGKGPEKLGAYGTDVPPFITQEIQERFPGADLSPGTSISTAIAAGIIAMTLSYVAALPSLLEVRGFDEICAKLYTQRGMKQMIRAMSLSTGYRQHFVNPIWYWGEKRKDVEMFVSICRVVHQMNEDTR